MRQVSGQPESADSERLNGCEVQRPPICCPRPPVLQIVTVTHRRTSLARS